MKFIISIALFAFSLPVFSQPPSANTIVEEAKATAARENKNVFIIFHASWCVWCHRMDSAMSEPAMKPLFDKNYVIRHVVVLESPNKKNLENPGGAELLAKYKGDKGGIPFWFIINPKGELLGDSREDMPDGTKGGNVGCPAQPNEVAYFIKVLKASSSLNAKELAAIEERFLKIK